MFLYLKWANVERMQKDMKMSRNELQKTYEIEMNASDINAFFNESWLF